MRSVVIGVDGGGTKTLGLLADAETGEELARASAGPSNYQAVGLDEAMRQIDRVLDELRQAAERRAVRIVAYGFGLSGLDRPRDDEVLAPALAARTKPCPSIALNDTFLILHAGCEGPGIGVVSGTGSNCVALTPSATRSRIGGLGDEFGDDGSGSDIGVAGIRAAFRGDDGRSAPTRLTAHLKRAYDLDRIDDLVDRFTADAEHPLEHGDIAPHVFECAAAGDDVATTILREAAHEIALSVQQLSGAFDGFGPFPVIAGGSVFQKPTCTIFWDAFVTRLSETVPQARPIRLSDEPVRGAVRLARGLLL